MPGKNSVFTTRVDPVSPPQQESGIRNQDPGKTVSIAIYCSLFRSGGCWRLMVEGAGTAPGSAASIPQSVYRHSRRTGPVYIARKGLRKRHAGFICGDCARFTIHENLTS